MHVKSTGPLIGVPVCTYMADIKPRWVVNGVRVLICERCNKCVPGYERLWLVREWELNKVDRLWILLYTLKRPEAPAK